MPVCLLLLIHCLFDLEQYPRVRFLLENLFRDIQDYEEQLGTYARQDAPVPRLVAVSPIRC
jgi:hypothetical protein